MCCIFQYKFKVWKSVTIEWTPKMCVLLMNQCIWVYLDLWTNVVGDSNALWQLQLLKLSFSDSEKRFTDDWFSTLFPPNSSSKSCIFCDIFLSAIRDNFYFEGKHSQLLVCIFSTAWVFADMSSVFLMQTMGKSDNLLTTKDIAKVFGPEPCLGLISPSNSQQPFANQLENRE